MRKILIVLATVLSFAVAAAPLDDKDKTALAGEWRAGACETQGGAHFTLEFAVTGGQIFLDAPGVGRMMMLSVRSTDADGSALTLAFHNGMVWGFSRSGGDALVSEAPPQLFAPLKGASFRHCRPPADRAALKLDHDAVAFFSVMMPPDYPTFIDASEKDGCQARGYRYVSIDLVGPEAFALNRGTLVPAARGAVPRLEDVTTWSIDAAEELPNVVRLTLTPAKGGPSEKISLVAGAESGLLTIPEWDAVYRRCAIRQLWANEAR